MKAAYELIGPKTKLVWAVANTCREALILASKRESKVLGEKVPPDHFKTFDAKSGWAEKCGPKVEDYETIMI